MITQTHWIAFLSIIFLFLAFDLGILSRHHKQQSYKEALGWTIFWVAISLVFSGWVYISFGSVAFFEFLTSYKIEKILSVDNIVVFAVVFETLNIPPKFQHRILFIGILSALILRGLMIFLGIELLEKFSWLLNIFGGFLILVGFKLFSNKKEETLSTKSKLWVFCKKIIPLSSKLYKDRFFVIENKKLKATTLFLALILIEFSDIIFALDSLPAIFSITTTPFIIYTSNILAILGLRSLYFVLVKILEKLKYLRIALGAVLILVGIKLTFGIHLHPSISLAIITFIFVTSIIASLKSKT